MAADSVRAGRAYVEVTVKDNLTAGLSKSLAKLRAFATAVNSVGSTLRKMGDSIADAGKKITGVGQDFLKFGGIVSGALLLVSKVAASYGSLINNASQRTGVGAEKLQALAYAAGLVDVRFESLEINIRRMQKSIAGLAKGGGEAAGAFETLGITLSDVADLAPEEQLKVIADRMNRITDPTLKASLALSIFGRSGTEMIPLLNTGADGIAKMMKRADELGIVLGRKDVTLLDAFDDALLEVFTQLKALTYQIGAAIAEAVQPFVGSVQKAIKAAIDWVKNNRGLFVSLVKLAAVAGAAALGIGVLLVVVGKIVVVAGAAVTVIGGLISVFAALASPVGVIVLSITALGAGLVLITGIAGKLGTALRSAFRGTLDDFVAALATGNVQTAWEVFCGHIKIAWLETIASMREAWNEWQVILGNMTLAEQALDSLVLGTAIDYEKKKIEDLLKKVKEATGGSSAGAGGAGDTDIGDLAKTAARLQFGGVNAELALGGAGGPIEETAKNTKRTSELLQGLPGALAGAMRGGVIESANEQADRIFDYWTKGTAGRNRGSGGVGDDSLLAQLRDEARRSPNNKAVQDRLARAEREVREAGLRIRGEGSPTSRSLELQEAHDRQLIEDQIEAKKAAAYQRLARHDQTLTNLHIDPSIRHEMMEEYKRKFYNPEMAQAEQYAIEARAFEKSNREKRRNALRNKIEVERATEDDPIGMTRDKALRFQYQAGIGADLIQGAIGGGPSTRPTAGGDKQKEIAENTKKTATVLTDMARRMGNGLAFT